MTARRPRRSRRQAPAAALPRPTGDAPPASLSASGRAARPHQQREHHLTRDYGYVRHDLLWVIGVTATTLAFIIGAWILAPSW